MKRASAQLLSVALILIAFHRAAWAQTVRVTTWNLPAGVRADPGTNGLQAAAGVLQQLNPDLILLQGARDWQMCASLAQALKPAEYHVAVCSSFPAPRNRASSRGEVAILAKPKAYFSWSEPWRQPDENYIEGGYVFAALQFGSQRVGCFSAELPETLPRAFSVQQLQEQIEVVRRWEANRVQAFLVAGTFNGDLSAAGSAARVFAPIEQEGFLSALESLAAGNRITVRPDSGKVGGVADYLFVDTTALVINPRVLDVQAPGHFPITCDLELDPTRVTAVRAVLAERAAAERSVQNLANNGVAPSSAGTRGSLAVALHFWWVAALICSFVVVGRLLTLRRRRLASHNTPPLLPASFDGSPTGSSAYTVVIATGSVTGSAAKPPPAPQPVIQLETTGTTHTESAAWQRRALDAERRAERAQEAIRRGVLPHFRRWLKQKFAQRLLEDRSQLLDAQHSAARKALAVDERLARIEAQLRDQNQAYERRIEDLNRELVAAKEENRELIRARIAQIKLEMEAARAKLLAQARDEGLPES